MDSQIEIHPRRDEITAEEGIEKLVGRQQTLAQLGLRAVSGTDFSSLVDEAVELVAENLSVEYCALLELLDDGEGLLLRSGVGWDEGVVGQTTLDTDMDLVRSHTLISRGPVIVGSLREERRLDIPRLLRGDHGAVSGLSTAIYAGDRVFGLLGAYTMEQRWFTEEEARFLEAVAKMLGAAHERGRIEERAQLRIEEETERAEAAERRFRLLSEANELLSASLDCATALATAARLAVPALADVCFVDMVEGDTIDRLVVMHADYVVEDLANELRRNYPLNSAANRGTPKVLRTGRPEIVPEVTDRGLVNAASDDEHHLRTLRRLAPKSYMCVPLQVRRRLVGAIGFISTVSGRRYGAEDLALAESLTRCAALALDRALQHPPSEFFMPLHDPQSTLAIDRTLQHLPDGEMARELIQHVKPNQRVADRRVTRAKNPGTAPELTARQLEVLQLLSEGMPAKKISEELRLSETTVRNHIRALLHALGARSQLEAVARARRAGLLVE